MDGNIGWQVFQKHNTDCIEYRYYSAEILLKSDLRMRSLPLSCLIACNCYMLISSQLPSGSSAVLS